ncbi:hypothetical protein D3C79_738850 [compost metagenome]
MVLGKEIQRKGSRVCRRRRHNVLPTRRGHVLYPHFKWRVPFKRPVHCIVVYASASGKPQFELIQRPGGLSRRVNLSSLYNVRLR